MFSLWFRIEYLVALLNDSKVGKRSIYNVVTRTFLQFLAPYPVCLLYNSEIKWTLNVPRRVETTGRGISCIAPMRVCLASNLHKSPIAVQRCAPPEADTWALLYSFCTPVHCTGPGNTSLCSTGTTTQSHSDTLGENMLARELPVKVYQCNWNWSNTSFLFYWIIQSEIRLYSTH